jgi:hypothetical protein
MPLGATRKGSGGFTVDFRIELARAKHVDMLTDGDIGQKVGDQVGVYLAKMKRQADAPDPG